MLSYFSIYFYCSEWRVINRQLASLVDSLDYALLGLDKI
jgi:hypothetical protein